MTLTIEQFLSQILPAGAVYAATSIDPATRKPSQRALNSVRDVAVYCLQADADGHDAFYAMAGFEKGWHDDPMGRTRPDGSPKKVLRTQENAKSIKAFWLDLDCGIGKDYPDQRTACQAIVQLTKTVQLPPPLVINSGNGIHCYWVLDKAIPADMWKKIACLFSGVVSHVGIQTDSQCTTDEARVLRPVGTHNHKHGQLKPVTALTPLKPVDPIAFVTAIKKYAVANGVKPVNIVRQENQAPANIANNPVLAAMWNNGNFQAVMGHAMMTERNKDADRIRRNCEQIATAGSQMYPNWFNMMTVMNCCPTGREVARDISAADPRHNDAQFFQKYDHDVVHGSNGPASCRSFDVNNPGVCANCPYFGKIVTPAELGRVPTSERAPQQARPTGDQQTQPSGDNTVTIQVQEPIVAPPAKTLDIKGFVAYPLDDPRFLMREGQGLVHVYEEEVDGGEPIRKEKVILESCFYLLYAVRMNMGKADQQMTYMFQITNPFDTPRQASMTAKDFASDVSIRNWLFNNQMLPTPGNEKKVGDCMRTYLAKLQRKIPCVDMKEHFGWSLATSRDGHERRTFVLGDRMLSANQPTTEIALPNKLSRYAENLGKSGTLEAWKAVPQFYRKHNIIWGQMGVALAFAAPLMNFAPGIARNGIVNFWSRASGTGKTTLQHVINSVWGHPEKQLLNVQSTANSRFNIMGLRHNLPVCLNEITNLGDVDLSEMLFQMSEGREKDRLADGGKDIMSSGSWSTITIMSANNTVFDKMQALSRDRDGEIKRVLELEVDMAGVSPALANEMTAAMDKNYGHAGAAFIQSLLDHPDLLKMIPTAMANWVEKHIASQDERYWMNTIAAAVIAAKLTNTLGLTDLDVDAITEYAMSMVARMRRSMADTRNDIATALGDYMFASLRDMLVVSQARNPASAAQAGMPDVMGGYVQRLPNGELGLRVEKLERLCYIRCTHLRAWCAKNGLTPELILEGHLTTNRPIQKRLGAGVASLVDGNVKCWTIRLPEDMDLDALSAEPEQVADGQAGPV